MPRSSLPTPSPAGTCIVTGASSGIGAEFARELARRGRGVTLVARREERLRSLADELAATGVRAEVVAADMGDPDARERLVATVAERGLTVDVLVNNAGFSTAGLYHTTGLADELQHVRVNVEAIVHLTHLVLPAMVERRAGGVLNVGSTAGLQPLPTQVTYAAGKAFVNTFTEGLHAELAGTGVHCTVLEPGPVKTEFFDAATGHIPVGKSPGFMFVDPDVVAREAVDGLERNARVVIPGLPVRGMALSSRYTPHAILLPLLRRAYK